MSWRSSGSSESWASDCHHFCSLGWFLRGMSFSRVPGEARFRLGRVSAPCSVSAVALACQLLMAGTPARPAGGGSLLGVAAPGHPPPGARGLLGVHAPHSGVSGPKNLPLLGGRVAVPRLSGTRPTWAVTVGPAPGSVTQPYPWHGDGFWAVGSGHPCAPGSPPRASGDSPSGPGLRLAFQTLAQSGCLEPGKVGPGEEAAAVLGGSLTGQHGAECRLTSVPRLGRPGFRKLLCVCDFGQKCSSCVCSGDGGGCCVSHIETGRCLYSPVAWPCGVSRESFSF